jgi:hypothetical protein
MELRCGRAASRWSPNRRTAVLTQIYEISSSDEARAVSELRIDHVGVLVGDGEFPREQPLSRAAEIAATIAAPAKFSALFLTTRAALIIEWAQALKPAILHLGAAPELLGPAEVAVLKASLPGSLIMRSVPVYGKRASRSLGATNVLPTIFCWTATVHRISRLVRSACRTIGASVAGSSKRSAPPSSLPEGLVPTTSPRRSTWFGRPAWIRRRRRTEKAATQRIWSA